MTRHNAFSSLRLSSPTSSARSCASSPPNRSIRSCSLPKTSHVCGLPRRRGRPCTARMGCDLLSYTPSFPNSNCVRCNMKPASECRAHARLRHSVLGSSHAAPDLADTSSRPIPRASLPATLPGPTPRSARRSLRQRPEHPHWRGPSCRRGTECPRDRSCRRARRSGKQAPPSPCNTASSEGSGSYLVLPGSSPITIPSPSSKAHQKAGPFAPPALPGFNAHTTLSDPRHGRRPKATLRPLPSPSDGSPPITRTTFPTCRAHYPGGSNGCACRLLPRSCSLPPKRAHNIRCLTFEVVVSYPFHPLVGKSVLVVGDKEHASIRHLIIQGPDGAKILLPEWMASPDAGAIRIVSHLRLCMNRLIQLRAFVDRLMASSPHTKTLPEENNETIADVKTGSLPDVALRAAIPTTKDGSGNAQNAFGRGDDDAVWPKKL